MSIQTYGNSSLAFSFNGFCPAIPVPVPAISLLTLPWYESRDAWQLRVEDEIQSYQTQFRNALTLSDPAVASLVDRRISMLATEGTDWFTKDLAAFTAGACLQKQWKLCTVGTLGNAASRLFFDNLAHLMGNFYSRESVLDDICIGTAAMAVKPRIQALFTDRIMSDYKIWSGLQEEPKGEFDFDRGHRHLEYWSAKHAQMRAECEEIVGNHQELLPVDKEEWHILDAMVPYFLPTLLHPANKYKKITLLGIEILFGMNQYAKNSVAGNHLYYEPKIYCYDVVSPGMKSLMKEMQEEGN